MQIVIIETDRGRTVLHIETDGNIIMIGVAGDTPIYVDGNLAFGE